MKNLFSLVLILFSIQFAFAQDEKTVPTKSVYFELGGPGMAYSLNYDFRFDKTNMNSWGMRVGAGALGVSGEDTFFSVPVMVNRLYGKGPHYFEIGMGATFLAYTQGANDFRDCVPGTSGCTGSKVESQYNFLLPIDGSPSVMGTMNFGYRRVPENGGFTWKINVNPVFNNNGFWPLFGGVGIGYAF